MSIYNVSDPTHIEENLAWYRKNPIDLKKWLHGDEGKGNSYSGQTKAFKDTRKLKNYWFNGLFWRPLLRNLRNQTGFRSVIRVETILRTILRAYLKNTRGNKEINEWVDTKTGKSKVAYKY